MPVPIISIVGNSGAGKTTFLEKLIRQLKRRGYRVATIKHDTHNFQMDHPGKDTYRLAEAGSDIVMISASGPASPSIAEADAQALLLLPLLAACAAIVFLAYSLHRGSIGRW